MSSNIDPLVTVPLLTLACKKALLTPETARALGDEAVARGISVADIIREKGILETPEVDQLEDEAALTQTLPGYELLNVIGKGGMGVVYRARQLNLDRIVAVKSIHLKEDSHTETAARFQQEAKAVAQLRHPNIVTAYDFGEHDGDLFLVMELLEGETLDDLIEREGRQQEAFTWLLLRQVIAGLVHANRQGLVHRDIKPSNLFLVDSPDGVCSVTGKLVKITDFGLVFRPDGKEFERLTQTGTPLGTPLYMAPEQLTGSSVDHRADVYAIGATAYHMLTGKPPFSGKTFYELAAVKIQGELPEFGSIAEHVSPESIELLRTLLAREPNERTETYEELISRIDQLACVRDLYTSQTTTELSSPKSISPKPRRLRWVIPAASFLVFAIGLLGGFVLWKNDQSKAKEPPKPTLVASQTVGQPLFNGTNFGPPLWLNLGGAWGPSTNSEGSNILAGSGSALCKLPTLDNYVVLFGMDLHEAEAVNVHFGIQADEEQSHAVLRITENRVMLGQMTDAEGEFTAKVMQKATMRRSDGPVYHEVRIERHGRYWWAYFDGKRIGYLDAHPQNEAATFRLEVEGGQAHFEGLQISQLVPPKS